MVTSLSGDAPTAAGRPPASGVAEAHRAGDGRLRPLSRNPARRLAVPPGDGGLVEFPPLREFAAAGGPVGPRGPAAFAVESRRFPPMRPPPQDNALLSAMLAYRDKCITERDRLIDDLRRRLAAADAERRTLRRQLAATAAGSGSAGRLQRTLHALAALLATTTQGQTSPRPATAPAARGTAEARALAEQRLLDLIARQHRRWVSRNLDAR